MKSLLKKFFNGANKFNSRFAKIATICFGTMWMFYAFFIYGLAPLFWPQYENQILYWSSFVQLIALPLLAVGTAVLSESSEKRAQEDHETIMAQFEEVKKLRRAEKEQMQMLLESVTILKEQKVGDEEEKAMLREILRTLLRSQNPKE